MTQRDNILQELKELESWLINASAANIYTVPAGYFDGLANEILIRIKAIEANDSREEIKPLSSLLSNIPVINPYSVPEGYFDRSADDLLNLVKNTKSEQSPAEELEELSPLLSSLKKEIPYKVPPGYFNNINIPENKKQETKVISITNRKWFRYAAAAVVVGFVATIGILFLTKKENIDPSTKSFAWVEKNMKKISITEIDSFIEMADNTTPILASATDKEDIKELIKNISPEEIQNFLNDVSPAETDDIIPDEEIFN